MIYEFHKKTQTNIGDFFSNPSRYYDFGNCASFDLYDDIDINSNDVVVGGGGLIHKKFQNRIQQLFSKDCGNKILWGVGHNFGRKHVTKSKDRVIFPDWLDQVDALGVRDWVDGYHDYYVPCSSCMHPAFDKLYTTTHDVAFFTHAYKSTFIPEKTDYHLKNNAKDFYEVIDFLGRANTIVTDSYHGAYWGQLLGKDVRVVSWSIKFDLMKYTPTYIQNIRDWKSFGPQQIPGNFLSECRDLNNQFYNKVRNINKI